MSSDVSLDAGETWPPAKTKQRYFRISWIHVLSAIVQVYCVIFQCVFLMVVALWMVVKIVSRRLCLRCKSWYSDFKERRPMVLPHWLAAFHKTKIPKASPEPQEPESFHEEEGQSSDTESDVPETTESNAEDRDSIAPAISVSTSGGCCSSSTQESRVEDITESESSASLHNVPENNQTVKRVPCSISAVVLDKYARKVDRSTSSSTESIEELDDSSEEDGVAGFDERTKSNAERSKSGNFSCTGSWKLRSAFQRAGGKSSDGQSCFPIHKASYGQAPCPDKHKFSLGPVISNLRRVCTRTFSAINKEITECMSPQGHKTRSKKADIPARATSRVAIAREVHIQPPPDANREAFQDLSVPEQRTSLQSSWNDGCSSGIRTPSDSLGEMHRGLLDSFSEGESSDSSNRQTADRPFGDSPAVAEKQPAFSVDALRTDDCLQKGDTDWTTQNSKSDQCFRSEDTGTKAFGSVFQRDASSSAWNF